MLRRAVGALCRGSPPKKKGGAAPAAAGTAKAGKGQLTQVDKLNELYLQCLEPKPKPV
jgi:hypothetical protein